VIYRRWPSRHELVIAALGHQQPIGRGRIPDTGSLREDALRIMQRAARRISDIGSSTVIGLLNDLIADDASPEIIDQLARGGGELMRQILARARQPDHEPCSAENANAIVASRRRSPIHGAWPLPFSCVLRLGRKRQALGDSIRSMQMVRGRQLQPVSRPAYAESTASPAANTRPCIRGLSRRR
jgi:hypothetical protein